MTLGDTVEIYFIIHSTNHFINSIKGYVVEKKGTVANQNINIICNNQLFGILSYDTQFYVYQWHKNKAFPILIYYYNTPKLNYKYSSVVLIEKKYRV